MLTLTLTHCAGVELHAHTDIIMACQQVHAQTDTAHQTKLDGFFKQALGSKRRLSGVTGDIEDAGAKVARLGGLEDDDGGAEGQENQPPVSAAPPPDMYVSQYVTHIVGRRWSWQSRSGSHLLFAYVFALHNTTVDTVGKAMRRGCSIARSSGGGSGGGARRRAEGGAGPLRRPPARESPPCCRNAVQGLPSFRGSCWMWRPPPLLACSRCVGCRL